MSSFRVCTPLTTSRLDLSLFTLQCINYSGHRKSLGSPASPTIGEASAYLSAHSPADTAPVSPYAISDWERTTYYNGISPGGDHPELLYRSDLLENPFPVPTGRHPHIPSKTARGVFNTRLNAVWHAVAPLIRELLKNLKIHYSAFKAARFLTHGEDGKDTLGPVVVWIATHPGTTTAENAHDASLEILSLLKANGVEGVVVEWYEGAVEKLTSPPLLRITNDTNPTHYVRRFLTATLGMPIATAEREADDAQGSVTLFFHENKDKDGNPSDRVFGVSNCHVLRNDTTVEYKFRGSGAAAQYVRVNGFRRFQRGLDEIKGCIAGYGIDADLLVREIIELEAKPKSKDQEEAVEDEEAIKAKRMKLAKVKKDIGILEAFYDEVNSQWDDIARRNIGHVHWAPEISVDVQGSCYTRDIGTFVVDPTRFKAQFKGNVVDLGAFQLTFFKFTLSNKNKNNVFQEPSLLPANSPICSTLRVVVGRSSSSPQIANSGSMG